MTLDALNIRHLQAVAAIVEAGSISAAARSVNLTQPAITQGIAKLEAQIGTSLFERRPGGMSPTEAAYVLVPRVVAALRLIASPRVTSTQLRAFVTLARAGSYAAAAARIGLSEASRTGRLATSKWALASGWSNGAGAGSR